MPDWKTIKLAVKFIRFAKNPDDKIKKEILSKAPPHVREKLDRMMTAYVKAQRGEMSKDEAARIIMNEIGIEDKNELIEMFRDIYEIVKDELESNEKYLREQSGLEMLASLKSRKVE